MSDARAALWKADSCIVYGGGGADAGELVTLRPAAELFDGLERNGGPTVLLMDASLLARVDDIRHLPRHVVIVAADPAAAARLGARAHLSLAGVSGAPRDRVMRAACELAQARLQTRQLRLELACARRDVHELKRIGMALMQEKNHATLLQLIADQGKILTESDGALLLLVQDGEGQSPFLRFALGRFDSVPDLSDLAGRTVPADNTSIVGHAAITGQPMIVDDAYRLPPAAAFQRNYEFDRLHGYYTRSMLIVPMVDRHDKVTAVLLFVNRKSDSRARIRSREDADRWVLPYTMRDLRLAQTLAGQAAVSIEKCSPLQPDRPASHVFREGGCDRHRPARSDHGRPFAPGGGTHHRSRQGARARRPRPI